MRSLSESAHRPKGDSWAIRPISAASSILDHPLTDEHYKVLVDFNQEDHPEDPSTPDIWCQWRPTEDKTGIEWDDGEKFYDYTEWIEYLIEHFLKPWGYIVNGDVSWDGEESADLGVISVKDNVVRCKHAVIRYE